MRKFSDPYETTARFNSTCSHCVQPIKKGTPIVYDKMRNKVYHKECGADIMRATRAAQSFDQFGTDIFV